MDQIDKFKGLVDLTLTTDDVVKLGEEMEILLQALYQAESGKFEQKLEEEVRVRVASEIRRLLQGGSEGSKEEVKSLLSSVNSIICSLPIIKLILAFEPSEVVIKNISNWARLNLEKGVVLDLSMDRSILGGAVVIYRGKFYDLSVRKKLGELFEKGAFTL